MIIDQHFWTICTISDKYSFRAFKNNTDGWLCIKKNTKNWQKCTIIHSFSQWFQKTFFSKICWNIKSVNRPESSLFLLWIQIWPENSMVKKPKILGGLPTLYSSRFLKKSFLKSLRKTVDSRTFLSIFSVLFYTKSPISVIFVRPECKFVWNCAYCSKVLVDDHRRRVFLPCLQARPCSLHARACSLYIRCLW